MSINVYKVCEGRDSNPRTTTGMDPKSIAFDLAGQPSRIIIYHQEGGHHMLPDAPIGILIQHSYG